MHQRTARTAVVIAVIVGLAAFLVLSLLSSPVALAHACGVSPLNLKPGETGSYTISADGIATNYEVINDDAPDVASITPGGSFRATDGVFTITALKMGVNLILIFWDAPEFNESDLCLLDVRVLDSSVAPTPTATAAPTATPTATAIAPPTSTPVVETPTPTATATPTPTPHATKNPITNPWPDITDAEEKAVQDLIDAGKKKEALEELVKTLKKYCCNFDTMEGESPIYDSTLAGEGSAERKKGGKVKIGDASFVSVAWLYSSLKHEMVHSQQWQDEAAATALGSNGREKEAYQRELDNAGNTGVSPADRADLARRLARY
ncbi:MAG: hypothetical protein IIA91_02995 [Chloroflexi bacterium]|nr:hypothetical protein [Chloroflexota bacterium]